jgi:hypothetical protein
MPGIKFSKYHTSILLIMFWGLTYSARRHKNMMNPSAFFRKHERRRSALAARAGRFILVVANVFLCFSLVLWAQTPASQPSEANQSWTVTRELHIENELPIRTLETHVRNGNRTLGKQLLQRLGSDGHFEAYQDIEKETVQVNSTTMQTITRIFGRDGGGAKALLQTMEEETEMLPDGSRTVRVDSTPDSDGRPQPTRREIAETKKISPGTEETKATVMLPSTSGGLAPAMQIEERRQRTGNRTEFKRTMQLLDGGREWQVNEVRQGTITEENNSRTTEENVSRLDYEGKLSELSRTVSTESQSSSGEKHSTVENYSVDVLGASRNGSLRLVHRVTSTETTDSSGQKTVVRQVEEPNPGEPHNGLRMTSVISVNIRSGPSGAQGSQRVQVRNGGGEFEVFAVETTQSDKIHAIQVQMTRSDKP